VNLQEKSRKNGERRENGKTRQAVRQVERQKDRYTGIKTGRQVGRQADRKAVIGVLSDFQFCRTENQV